MQSGERVRVQARPAGAHEGPARREQAAPPAEQASERIPLERIALAAIAAEGEPLRADIRTDMEARLGADFGAVRVHAGDTAARAARSIAAEAFTVGEDVIFGQGMYAPYDEAGRRRLAHELAHVLQQRHGAAHAASWEVSRPGDELEQAAERAASRASAPAHSEVPTSTAHEAPHAKAPASTGHQAPATPTASTAPRVIQRRALLDLSP